MNTEQKSNLARVALGLLENDTVVFDIRSFFKNGNWITPKSKKDYECGTSCCFLGFAPYVLGNFTVFDYWGLWGEYCGETFGFPTSEYWDFLFAGNWPNDKSQAAARAAQYLEDGVPEGFTFQDEYSEVDLKRRLERFVINP